MIVLIVLGAILLVLVVAFVLFYRHSRTPEWGDSEFRKSMLADDGGDRPALGDALQGAAPRAPHGQRTRFGAGIPAGA